MKLTFTEATWQDYLWFQETQDLRKISLKPYFLRVLRVYPYGTLRRTWLNILL
ncbi:hypothetical protein A0J48_007685 [Sphaerospermopsis aphanizomenoides BCCUSP55]|uniref:hypothetical protein n=1 Tax=Sphaerospermopsis aphanizomenoides TaxID=459663 RepID=UPI0019073342|nr:hypothetical protein [Sphaerospermopsis aphanizomenoides]MBK1987418.1 hypothetical protein [Sphaerospermopsis aphanizomenoides BCCUSP55]